MRNIVIHKYNGQIANINDIHNAVTMWCADAMNGEYVLTFERAKKPRSNDQNRLMWLWFNCIAKNWSEATGRAFIAADVHDAYCRLLLPIDTPKGRIAGRTRTLTSEQMTDFLNKVQTDAATEYGITLPNPDDLMFEQWAQQYNNY